MQCRQPSLPLLCSLIPQVDDHDKSKTMRNLWCFVSCPFAVGFSSPLARLGAVAKATASLKTSFVAPVQLFIQNKLLPYLPLAIGRQVCWLCVMKYFMVLSLPTSSRCLFFLRLASTFSVATLQCSPTCQARPSQFCSPIRKLGRFRWSFRTSSPRLACYPTLAKLRAILLSTRTP